MKSEDYEQWERLITPEILRKNLLVCSVYIVAFETLNNVIIKLIRTFYWRGLDEEGNDILDDDYYSEVAPKEKSLIYSSLQWLYRNHVINQKDLNTYDNIKSMRNKIAHELNSLIEIGVPTDLENNFIDLLNLVDKIEKWWIVNFEIPTASQFDGMDIREDEIVSNVPSQLRMIFDIALGPDEEAYRYIRLWNTLTGK